MVLFSHRNSLTRPVVQKKLGLTNPVGIQPFIQLHLTRKFANMDLHFALAGALAKRYGLRFCSSPSIRDLGCVATRRTRRSGVPFGSQGNSCRIPVVSESEIMVSQRRQYLAAVMLISSLTLTLRG